MIIDNEFNCKFENWLESFSQMIEDTEYCINENGEFCIVEYLEIIPISNFILRPVEIIMKVSESGIAEDHKYVFEGVLKKEKLLKKMEVLQSDLGNSKWIQRWNPFCEIYGKKQNFKLLLKFIEQSLKYVPKRIEYNTIGWHEYKNQWFFLHSGGVIGNTQNNNVSTSNDQFFFNKDDTFSGKESYLESLNMLDIFDHKLSYSLLSFLLTSIITTPLLMAKEKKLTPNYLVWVMGRSGYGKTTILEFLTNIYERENLTRPDAHKTSIIIPGLKEHKDCIFIIDDYGTSKTKQNMYSVTDKVEYVIRTLSDKNYSSSGISKGMVLIAGEQFLPPDEKYDSSKKRIIRLKMDNLFNRMHQDTYDAQKAEKYNQFKDKRFLPTSITHYIEWLSEKLNLTFIDDYKREFDSLRSELGETYDAHGRHADSFAHQIIAFNFYMKYGKERGFLTTDDFVRKCNYAKQVFEKLLEDQNSIIFDTNIELFFNTLLELILSEEIKVEFNKTELDFDRKVYGIIKTEKGQEVLKFDWDVVYGLVTTHLGNSKKRDKLAGNKNLARLLDECDLLCFNENGTTTTFEAINKGKIERCRVINFKTAMIPEYMEVIIKKSKETESFKDKFMRKIGGEN